MLIARQKLTESITTTSGIVPYRNSKDPSPINHISRMKLRCGKATHRSCFNQMSKMELRSGTIVVDKNVAPSHFVESDNFVKTPFGRIKMIKKKEGRIGSGNGEGGGGTVEEVKEE